MSFYILALNKFMSILNTSQAFFAWVMMQKAHTKKKKKGSSLLSLLWNRQPNLFRWIFSFLFHSMTVESVYCCTTRLLKVSSRVPFCSNMFFLNVLLLLPPTPPTPCPSSSPTSNICLWTAHQDQYRFLYEALVGLARTKEIGFGPLDISRTLSSLSDQSEEAQSRESLVWGPELDWGGCFHSPECSKEASNFVSRQRTGIGLFEAFFFFCQTLG